MNIGETWSISLPPESLQKEETSLMFSGKEVNFARSLFDKQHDFNDTSSEVNKKK